MLQLLVKLLYLTLTTNATVERATTNAWNWTLSYS